MLPDRFALAWCAQTSYFHDFLLVLMKIKIFEKLKNQNRHPFWIKFAFEPITPPSSCSLHHEVAYFSIEVGVKTSNGARKWSMVPKHWFFPKSWPVCELQIFGVWKIIRRIIKKLRTSRSVARSARSLAVFFIKLIRN